MLIERLFLPRRGPCKLQKCQDQRSPLLHWLQPLKVSARHVGKISVITDKERNNGVLQLHWHSNESIDENVGQFHHMMSLRDGPWLILVLFDFIVSINLKRSKEAFTKCWRLDSLSTAFFPVSSSRRTMP